MIIHMCSFTNVVTDVYTDPLYSELLIVVSNSGIQSIQCVYSELLC